MSEPTGRSCGTLSVMGPRSIEGVELGLCSHRVVGTSYVPMGQAPVSMANKATLRLQHDLGDHQPALREAYSLCSRMSHAH